MSFTISWGHTEVGRECSSAVMKTIRTLASEKRDVLETIVVNTECGFVYSLVVGGPFSVANYWQVDGVPPAFISVGNGKGRDIVCSYYDSQNEFDARNTVSLRDALEGLEEFLRFPSQCPEAEGLQWEEV